MKRIIFCCISSYSAFQADSHFFSLLLLIHEVWVGNVEKGGFIQSSRLLATVKKLLDHKVYILLHAQHGGLFKCFFEMLPCITRPRGISIMILKMPIIL